MSELSYERAKEELVEDVYLIVVGTSLCHFRLDWDEDSVYDMYGDLQDHLESIQDLFDTEFVYESIDDAYNEYKAIFCT